MHYSECVVHISNWVVVGHEDPIFNFVQKTVIGNLFSSIFVMLFLPHIKKTSSYILSIEINKAVGHFVSSIATRSAKKHIESK